MNGTNTTTVITNNSKKNKAVLDSPSLGYEHVQDIIQRQEKTAGMYLLDFSAKSIIKLSKNI